VDDGATKGLQVKAEECTCARHCSLGGVVILSILVFAAHRLGLSLVHF
jgi:hypothetical protein